MKIKKSVLLVASAIALSSTAFAYDDCAGMCPQSDQQYCACVHTNDSNVPNNPQGYKAVLQWDFQGIKHEGSDNVHAHAKQILCLATDQDGPSAYIFGSKTDPDNKSSIIGGGTIAITPIMTSGAHGQTTSMSTTVDQSGQATPDNTSATITLPSNVQTCNPYQSSH